MQCAPKLLLLPTVLQALRRSLLFEGPGATPEDASARSKIVGALARGLVRGVFVQFPLRAVFLFPCAD